MDVAADLQRRLELQQARLRQEDLAVDERNDGGRGGSGKVSERFGAGLMTAATIAGAAEKKNRLTQGASGANLNEIGALAWRARSIDCLLYTSPSPRDVEESRMPSSA